MSELLGMWKNTRMLVLVSISAALYVAVLLPFKIIPIIPGLTELRPGAAIPVTLSFMFGPAAAWGAGMGNVISDIFGGMFGPGSFFGFWGNFLYGFVPYALFRALTGRTDPIPQRKRDWVVLVLTIVTAAVTIGVFIGWGADLLKLAPFSALGNIITINNVLMSLSFSIILLYLIYPRVARWGLLYQEIMAESPSRSVAVRKVGAIFLLIGAFGGLVLGNLLSIGILDAGFLSRGFSSPETLSGTLLVGLGMTPAILLLGIAVILL